MYIIYRPTPTASHTQGQGAEAERLAERGYRIFREKIVHSPYQQQQVRYGKVH